MTSAPTTPPVDEQIRAIIKASSLRAGFEEWMEVERLMRCAYNDGYRAGESREHAIHGGKPINDACPGCGNTGDGHYANCPRAEL